MFPPSISYRFPKCIRMHHLSSHIGETEDEAMRSGGGGVGFSARVPIFSNRVEVVIDDKRM